MPGQHRQRPGTTCTSIIADFRARFHPIHRRGKYDLNRLPEIVRNSDWSGGDTHRIYHFVMYPLQTMDEARPLLTQPIVWWEPTNTVVMPYGEKF